MASSTDALDSTYLAASKAGKLKSIALNQRIQSIDVIRGFALIGIFFMNVEWFNRAFGDFGNGIQAGQTAVDYWASYFVNYFIAGKFWTIFSLLFGMGFAVMLSSAEKNGNAFIRPYIRRIVALAVFGILHTLLLWPGDILYSYAFTAAGLLIILFGRWKWILICLAGLAGFRFIPGMESFGAVLGGIIFMSIIALYVRNEKTTSVFGMRVPLFSAILAVLGVLVSSAAVISFFVAKMHEAQTPLCLAAFFILLSAWLSGRYYQPVELRLCRTGSFLYVMPFLVMLAFGLSKWSEPRSNVMDSHAATARAAEIAIEKVAMEKLTESEKNALQEKNNKARKLMTDAQKKLEKDADRINRINEQKLDIAKETAVLKNGSYTETIKHRTEVFMKSPFDPAGLMFVAIGMFILGVWFVRSGIMTHDRENLPLFRRIALIGLPIGLGLSVLSSLITVSHIPGENGDHWLIANAVLELASLPTCLAYMSIIILMFHSNSIFSHIRVLAPYGRMALSNYLMQSLIQAWFFYGWGLGYFGMGRANQLLFAIGIIILQIIISHWWLSRFAYGPLEWVWRGITYWQVPNFRHQTTSA